MKINIHDGKKVALVQEEFSSFFPFLKLDFYGGGKEYTPTHPNTTFSINGHIIKDFRKIHTEGEITIFPEMSVADLEQIFQDHFGLSVKVLRSAGNIWMQPSYSDFWSLEKQNRQGEITYKSLQAQKEKRNL